MKFGPEFAIRSRRVLVAGALVPACVWVREGKIAGVFVGGVGITEPVELPQSVPVFNVDDRIIMPGVVDTHAHINEPGRTEWEGFATATRAAAAGGITTVIDMPLNSIPATTTLAALEVKDQSAAGHCMIDYGFWGGVIPGNTSELEPMIRAGAFGFKAFLCPSGVDEFPMSRESDLRAAMPILAKHGIPLLVHAEIESLTRKTQDAHQSAPKADRTYRTYLESRPAHWEVDAIRLLIRLARETGCRTHIVHLSAAEALPDLAAARSQGVPITAETCPHYLTLDAESIPDGATYFKCAPPIRGKSNRETLWQALKNGQIEFVVSDHSPCTPALKHLESGDFDRAWGGIAGLQFSLAVVWTEMKSRGFSIAELSRLMSSQTAKFLGLEGRKGVIAIGADADFIVFDPEATFTPDEASVLHRHRITPYVGRPLCGRVETTFVRGHCVFDSGAFASFAHGKRLQRPPFPISIPAQKGSSR